ncbi:MAG: transglutaminase domain-containing protein [Bradyrhizobium sp.]|nr:transglutaminase domain-containing protein [Bradyrhizobium sp.]
MENVERWMRHSAMSDIGRHDAASMPANIGALNTIVQGLIIHTDWLASYGVNESDFARVWRDTLPVADRFALVLDRDSRPLTTCRSPAQRTVGTCRDFALVLCGLLRSKGVSARLRCGFADYFNDGWEDHWVCEYWDRETQRWRLSDAQLDDALKEKCRIAFDPTDIPRDRFLTAGQAWAACRAGRRDPDQFGHGAVKGLWFAGVNVVRDHYVVNNRETSDWDRWRDAPQSKRVVSKEDCAVLDPIAARPEQPIVDVTPDWLA